MEILFDETVRKFIELAHQYQVRMIMVGGGAVNFHGYQRSSADVDFWIDTTPDNLTRLIEVLYGCGYEISNFPNEVRNQLQNISIKISPVAEIELITRFDPGKTFNQALADSESVEVIGYPLIKYNVLSYDDLIQSKILSSRPRDLFDIQELQRIKSLEEE